MKMTVEEIRRNLGDSVDNFPIGMRVLAVDDDPTCLMLLDGLLRKCQYQVTTTSQSRTALEMLRENRNRFDLIISDVYMPDMDGFKLLELVGLEMDLPVIMLSANSDPKLVMKGITHGACDYLVKPVRLEELRNIWQHVIRRKKFDPKSQNNPTAQEGSEGGDGSIGNTDQNGKLNRKRKDEEEEVGEDSNGNENEDSGTQKRPRVIWSIELHRKFVAAVNQLGIEKAFPKRILDMMNVEGLTRENVASHLQKYRLYLKRISSVASHQANMVAVLGGKDTSYLRMSSLDGLGGDFQTFSHLPNTAMSSYPPSGIFHPAGTNLHNLSSSSLIRTTRPQNSCNSVNSPRNFQNTSLFQGLDPTHIGKFSSFDDTRFFSAGSTFTDTRVTVGNSSNSLASAPLSFSSADSSVFMNGSIHNQSWISPIQLPKFEPFNQDQFTRYNNSSINNIHNNPIEFSSNTTVSTIFQDQNQRHGIQEKDYTNISNTGFSNFSQQNNGFYNGRMAISSVSQSNMSTLNPSQNAKVDSLDDLMHTMMRQEQVGKVLMNGEFAFDAYAFGSCI